MRPTAQEALAAYPNSCRHFGLRGAPQSEWTCLRPGRKLSGWCCGLTQILILLTESMKEIHWSIYSFMFLKIWMGGKNGSTLYLKFSMLITSPLVLLIKTTGQIALMEASSLVTLEKSPGGTTSKELSSTKTWPGVGPIYRYAVSKIRVYHWHVLWIKNIKKSVGGEILFSDRLKRIYRACAAFFAWILLASSSLWRRVSSSSSLSSSSSSLGGGEGSGGEGAGWTLLELLRVEGLGVVFGVSVLGVPLLDKSSAVEALVRHSCTALEVSGVKVLSSFASTEGGFAGFAAFALTAVLGGGVDSGWGLASSRTSLLCISLVSLGLADLEGGGGLTLGCIAANACCPSLIAFSTSEGVAGTVDASESGSERMDHWHKILYKL